MSVLSECPATEGDEIEHFLEAVVYPLVVHVLDLLHRQVGCGVGKLVVAVVIARLKDVLHHVLEITVAASRHCLAPKLVKRLARAVDVMPYAAVAAVYRLVGIVGAHVDHVVNPEVVSAYFVRRPDNGAELPYDTQHR